MIGRDVMEYYVISKCRSLSLLVKGEVQGLWVKVKGMSVYSSLSYIPNVE